MAVVPLALSSISCFPWYLKSLCSFCSHTGVQLCAEQTGMGMSLRVGELSISINAVTIAEIHFSLAVYTERQKSYYLALTSSPPHPVFDHPLPRPRGRGQGEGEGVKKLAGQQIPLPPHPWPLSPKMGARGKKKIELTPSPPLGERVAAGRVRGRDSILSHLRG